MNAKKDRSKAVVILQGLGSFISYAVFHASLGWYIFTCYAFVRDPWGFYGPLKPGAEARMLAAQLIGLVIGAYAGVLACLSYRILKDKMQFVQRFLLALSSPALMSVGLLIMMKYPHDWRTLEFYVLPGVLLGFVSGLINVARRNPWSLLFRGLGAKQRERKVFAIISGLGLRLGGLLGLLLFVLLLAVFVPGDGAVSRQDLLVLSTAFVYLGLTTLIAFVSPPRWIVFPMGLLVNVPAAMLAVKWWQDSINPTLPIVYLTLWALFIVGRPASGGSPKLGSAVLTEPALAKGR